MIKELTIDNFAIIKSQKIEFDEKINLFCGDSGAGKSIIIESLKFLLGGKGNKDYIRTNTEALKVTGLFSTINNFNLQDVLHRFDIDFGEDILISRTLNLAGKSEIKVNGYPITLTMLKEIGRELMDIYSQNDSVQLLTGKYQLQLIDAVCFNDVEPLKFIYSEKYSLFEHIVEEIKNLCGNEDRATRLEILKYQLEELENAGLYVGEDVELENEKRIIINLEKIRDNYRELFNNFEDGNSNLLSLLKNSEIELNNIEKYDEDISPLTERIKSVKYEIMDIFDELKNKCPNDNIDGNRLDEIETRLEEIKRLKRKYGIDIETILNKKVEMQNAYDSLVNAEENLNSLQKDKEAILEELFEIANHISAIRRKTAKILAEKIETVLKKIQIKNPQVEFAFNECKNIVDFEKCVRRDGYDTVEILFSANLGEPKKPLNKIASGGEMSRFMLGIKAVTSDSMFGVDSMIFDEIDTGISGETALAEGEMMIDISHSKQLIVISHLIQIASTADRHFYVEKKSNESETYSVITPLKGENEINSLAKLISGVKYGETAINHAQQIKKYMNDIKIKKQNEYK